MQKPIKILCLATFILITATLIFLVTVMCLSAKSVAPLAWGAIVIALALPAYITTSDMERAYVEIDGDDVIVVDYYFGVKKEKALSLRDIASAEIVLGYSSTKMRGYRWGFTGFRYIVFRDNSDNYLFKLLFTPEAEKLFKDYI